MTRTGLIDPKAVADAVKADIEREDPALAAWLVSHSHALSRLVYNILGYYPQQPPPAEIKSKTKPNEGAVYFSTQRYLFDPRFFSYKPDKKDKREGAFSEDGARRAANHWDVTWDSKSFTESVEIPIEQAGLVEEALQRGYTLVLTGTAVGIYRDPIMFNRIPIALIGRAAPKQVSAKVTPTGVEYKAGFSPEETQARDESIKAEKKQKQAEIKGLLDEDQMRADARTIGLTEEGFANLVEWATGIDPKATWGAMKEPIGLISIAGALAYLARWATPLAFQRTEAGKATRYLIERLGGFDLGAESEREEKVQKEKASRATYQPLLIDDTSSVTVAFNYMKYPREVIEQKQKEAKEEQTRRWKIWRKEQGFPELP